jgi:hypothetical protein
MSTAIGIIEQFLHPPIGLVRLEHIPEFPSSSSHGLQRIRGTRYVDAYGIRVLVLSAPPGYGFVNDGIGAFYDRTMWQGSVDHLLFDNTIATTQRFDSNQGLIYFLFNESFPYFVNIVPSPGVQLDAWWMLRFFP